MGNLGLQIGQGKEQWMEPLHDFICASVPETKTFIDDLTEIQEDTGTQNSHITCLKYRGTQVLRITI